VPPASPDCTPPSTTDVAFVTTVAGPAIDPGACESSLRMSALGSPWVQHLGTLAVNTATQFTVPEGIGSFTVLEQAVQASSDPVVFAGVPPLPNAAVPLRIYTPGGSLFYDDAAALPADFSTANAVTYFGKARTGTFTVPNTSHTLTAWQRGVPAGVWSVVAGDWAAECALDGSLGCTSGADLGGVYDLTVLLRPGPVPSTGTVDLDVYLVTARFQASTAPADSGLSRMVSTVSSMFGAAGICLGRVRYLDVPAWARTSYSTGIDSTRLGPCDALSQLLTLSRPGTAVPIFLVDDIQGSGGTARTVGIDGAIPGPSTVGGTIASGAVVNASDVGFGVCGAGIDLAGCGADATAAVVAHETGHYLGLYHVTEKTGTVFDPVADTPRCVCSQCAPAADRAGCGAATTVGDAECSGGGGCAGADNLMFWLVGGDRLSAQQAQLMRANPAMR
jgi:hypothetical protein